MSFSKGKICYQQHHRHHHHQQQCVIMLSITAVKSAGIGVSTIKRTTFSTIESDLDTLGGNSGGPVIDRITNKAIGILIRGYYKEYDFDQAHLKKTGERQVINFRMPRGLMIKGKCIYSTAQKISESMCNPINFNKLFAEKGQQSRKNLSDINSDIFRNEKTKQYNIAKHYVEMQSKKCYMSAPIAVMSIIFIPNFIRKKIDESKITLHEQVEKTMKEYNINYKEAYHFIEIDKLLAFESSEKKIEIARNMCAYNIAGHLAYMLYELEVTKFNRQFSPDKILDIIKYCDSKYIHFEPHEIASEGILKRMQKNAPYYSSQMTEKDKYKSVKNALIMMNTKCLQKDPVYTNYTDIEINRIAQYYVEKYYESVTLSEITFDSSRVALRIVKK